MKHAVYNSGFIIHMLAEDIKNLISDAYQNDLTDDDKKRSFRIA